MWIYIVVWEDGGAYIEGAYLGRTMAQERAATIMKDHDDFIWEAMAPDRWYGAAKPKNPGKYRDGAMVKIVQREIITLPGFVADFVADTTKSHQTEAFAVTPMHQESAQAEILKPTKTRAN